MSMICFTVVPLAALAVLNSSKFAQPPRPAAQRWLQRLGPTNGGVAMFVALFGGNMKPLSSEMFRMISSLSTLEKPHFSVFLLKPTALSHEFGFYLFEFHLDPMFPVTARCKKNQCPPWQRHQDGTRDAGTVLQEKFQEIVVAGLPKILLDNHRGTRLARSGVDIHQVQMVQTRRIHNFHTARRQTRRPEGHNQRMCIFLIDQNLGSMWTKNC